MSKSQRNKGAGYEREVVDAFNRQFGTHYRRHIGQARDGGEDAVIGPFVLEMKRRKSLKTISDWLLQCIEAIVSLGIRRRIDTAKKHYPIVVMREDNGRSMVLLTLDDFLSILSDTVFLQDRIRKESPEPRRNVDDLL